ncbi:MAG: hypothetical protein KDA92_15265, partial [Planctomycetales bacterium]|nr:hypothetical protein [Planctomycetales bacterium]
MRVPTVFNSFAVLTILCTLGNVQTGNAVAADAPPKPATAKVTRELLDLRKLPQLEVVQKIELSPTYVYSSVKGRVSSAVAFYQNELQEAGWKVVPTSMPDSPQYRDLLLSKDGNYLRLMVGESGDEGVVGVGISLLGNVDLRKLPRLDNRPLNKTNSPINANYNTPKSILDVVKFCRAEFAKQGWHEYVGMTPSPIDVPHYKQLDFMQNGVRVMVSVVRSPQLPTQETIVSYMSNHVLPYDVPLLSDATNLKLDPISNHVEFITQSKVKSVESLYREVAPSLNWQLRTDESRSNETSAALFFVDDGDHGFAAAITPAKEGGTRVALDRISFQEEPPAEDPPAETPPPTAIAESDERLTNELNALGNELQQEIQNAVKQELKGLKGLPTDSGLPVDLNSLLEDATKILDEVAGEDEDAIDESTTNDKSTAAVNELSDEQRQKMVADDKALAGLAVTASECTVTFDGKQHRLTHSVAFRSTTGTPTIFFSEQPLNVDRIRRTLAKQQDPSLSDSIGKS